MLLFPFAGEEKVRFSTALLTGWKWELEYQLRLISEPSIFIIHRLSCFLSPRFRQELISESPFYLPPLFSYQSPMDFNLVLKTAHPWLSNPHSPHGWACTSFHHLSPPWQNCPTASVSSLTLPSPAYRLHWHRAWTQSVQVHGKQRCTMSFPTDRRIKFQTLRMVFKVLGIQVPNHSSSLIFCHSLLPTDGPVTQYYQELPSSTFPTMFLLKFFPLFGTLFSQFYL